MKRAASILFVIGMLILIFGGLAAIKGLQIRRMVVQAKEFSPQPETVNAVQVRNETWESVLTSVGSLRAVQGVTVAAELPGRVAGIGFKSGTEAADGQLLVQQDISAEQAQARGAQSELELARKNLERARKMVADKVISKSTFDDHVSRYETAEAKHDGILATIEKKTIRAPFAGRLGIRQVNLGQSLEAGQPIVSLQSLDPIYVDFLLPQKRIGDIQKGLSVRVFTDSPEGGEKNGAITAVNAEVDNATRNIRLQATLDNTDESLRPGMYVSVKVVLPEKRTVLSIPATAVLHAPYGDSVFVVQDVEKSEKEQSGKVIRQKFVTLGEQRGDFVAVTTGLMDGERVVSTGVFKLRNGQAVVVDNTFSPKFEETPRPDDA